MSLGLLGALGGLGKGLTQYGQTLFSEAIEEKREARLQAIRDKEYARNRADQVSDRDARITATQQSAQMQIDAADARQAELLAARASEGALDRGFRASEGALDRQSREDIASANNAAKLLAKVNDDLDIMSETDGRGNETLFLVSAKAGTKTPLILQEPVPLENTNSAPKSQNEWNKQPGRASMPPPSALSALAEDPSDENLEAFFNFYKYIPSKYSYTPEKYR